VLARNWKFGWITVLFSCQLLLPSQIELKATRIERQPALDGYLSDAVWQQAIPFIDFKMSEPTPNSSPSEKTEIRVIYDRDNLFLGIHCYDHEPAKIAANSMAHDNDSTSDDLIRILLDPFQDMRNAYIFFVNPRGARSEGLAFGEHYSLDWDGIWDAKSRILADGWSVEIKIPFKTISFNPGLNSWGLNVERYIPRKLETIRLSGFTPDHFFYNPMEAAALTGIEHIKQGKGFTFRPYGTINSTRFGNDSSKHQWKMDGGFDIYKNFTPNFVGAFSLNTDFAETEADDRQINLTRFPLYFPEKRTFFLEGSEIFNFVGSGDSFSPFYSRRIGLYQDQQVPIFFGTKLFGKLGDTNMALLDVQTRPDDELGLPGQNLLAGRIYQNIWSQSKVGVIFTSGDPAGQGRNSLLGADFTFRTSRLHGDKNFSISSWFVYNWNTMKAGKHQAYGFGIDYPNDLWDTYVSYKYYGDSLDPGLGFISRAGVKVLSFYLAYQPRPEKGLIGKLVRQFFFQLEPTFYWDLAGNLQTWSVFTAPINLRTQRGEHIEFNVIPNHDVLPGDFEVAKGVVIPAGPYDFLNYRIEYSTPEYHPAQFSVSWQFGQFYSGTYHDAELGLAYKLNGYANISLTANIVRGDLPQGKFSENVYRLKADFYLSPNLGLLNYIQFDDAANSLGANIRLRWQITPGNLVYLVFTKNWERRWSPESRFAPLGDQFVCKIQVSWRP
jgi:hypothetical protein